MNKFSDYEPIVTVKSFTQPVAEITDQGVEDLEQLIAYIARVSNPTNQMNTKTTERLIAYLMAHRHWSPFEFADITVEVLTTRDIARQMLRHRSFNFQEFSQRYADPTGMEFIIKEARLQDQKNRQNSFETEDDDLQEWWAYAQMEVCNLAKEKYDEAIERGIAKECARVVLPEGNTPSVIMMKGNIRSWIHYLLVRSKAEGTQKEHYIIADKICEEIKKFFPRIVDVTKTKE